MHRRVWWLSLAALVVAAAIATAIVLGTRSHSGTAAPPAATTSSVSQAAPSTAASATSSTPPAIPPLDATQAATLVSELTSGDLGAVTSALYMPAGQPVPAALVAKMAAQRPVAPVAGSLHSVSADVATMQVTVGSGAHWLLILDYVDGKWMIADTVQQ